MKYRTDIYLKNGQEIKIFSQRRGYRQDNLYIIFGKSEVTERAIINLDNIACLVEILIEENEGDDMNTGS